MNLSDVDPTDPQLTTTERQLLEVLLRVRHEYMEQSRHREAHAMAKAIVITWHFTRRDEAELELEHTDFGTLDINLPLGAPARRGRV